MSLAITPTYLLLSSIEMISFQGEGEVGNGYEERMARVKMQRMRMSMKKKTKKVAGIDSPMPRV